MILLVTEVRLTGLQFPRSSLYHLPKMGIMLSLFELVGTLLKCHNYANMMDSGLATSSLSSQKF